MDTGVLALGIPILALLIPIVAILSAHQRKMAEIIHQNRTGNADSAHEISALRHEVQQLKELVHQQTIAIDRFAGYTGTNQGALGHSQSSQTTE